MKYAIIGGTGVYGVEGNISKRSVSTDYGSIDVEVLTIGENEIVFFATSWKRAFKATALNQL